jgi:2,3-bisphosphoglycerate-dependent phosphoglycerate mutase
MEEARVIARRLKEETCFGKAFTSLLKRTIRTLEIVLKEYGSPDMDIVHAWQLNEKHWGALQKVEMDKIERKYGTEQLTHWRNNFYDKPPKLETTDPRSAVLDSWYKQIPHIPNGESLNDLSLRVIPYLKSEIMPLIAKGENVLVISHRHVLRVIMRYLKNSSVDNMEKIDIEEGRGRIFTFNEIVEIVDEMEIKQTA